MLEFFSTWHPGAVTALVAVASLFLTIIVAILSGNWRRVRQTEIAASLKRELIQQGYPVEQIGQLVNAPLDDEDETVNQKGREWQLAALLVRHEVSGEAMEGLLRTYQATDAATRKAVYDSVEEMLEAGGNEEQVMAAVRALCPPKPVPSEAVCARVSAER